MNIGMKVYVATKLANEIEHASLARVLFRAGCEITYDWTQHGSVAAQPDRFGEVAAAELNGVLTAEAVIVILPGGAGTHVELGAALAANIPVIVVGPEQKPRWGAEYPCVFWHHPRVAKHVMATPGWEMAVVDYLRRLKQDRQLVRPSEVKL